MTKLGANILKINMNEIAELELRDFPEWRNPDKYK